MKKLLSTATAALALTLLATSPHSATAASSNSNESVSANVFVNLAKKLVPSVVNISTLTTVKGGQGQASPDDIMRKFFGDLFRQYNGGGGGVGPRGGNPDDEEDDGGRGPVPPPPPGSPPGPNPKNLPKAMSLGTGFIIDSSGLILTNNHVVADADEIKISFTESLDEKPTDGEVVGRDTELDLALIRVKSKREMTAVVLGDSDALEVGEYVMAIGNPFGQGHSVTHGIISAKGRLAPDFQLANYLQTDAPINPGNSGGPLVNLKGEVIGINNAIDQRAQGIGFAIPINLVKKVLPQLRTKGTVARGYIGVLVNEMTPELAAKLNMGKDSKSPFVTNVYPDAPAEKAGLKPYDVILEFNGKPIHSSNELIMAVTGVDVGQSVPIKVSRGGSEKNLHITVTQRPGTQDLAGHGPQKKKKLRKAPKNGPDVGMTIEDVTDEIARELGMPKPVGVLVASTIYGGPADKAGLMRGDIVLEVDRKAVKDADQFYSIVKEKKSYLLRVRRADEQGHEVFSVVVLDLKE
jgi:serine protease Do